MKRKKQAKPKSRLEKILTYHILSLPLHNWLFMIFLATLFLGLCYLLMLVEVRAPTKETRVAKVSNRWSRAIEGDTGGYMVYRVELNHEGTTTRCSVPSMFNQLWFQLEIGESYEFDLNLAHGRCSIVGFRDIE